MFMITPLHFAFGWPGPLLSMEPSSITFAVEVAGDPIV